MANNIIRNCCILFFTLTATACGKKTVTASGENQTDDKLQVFSSYERGAIGEIKYIGTDSVMLNAKHWKKHDGIGDQYYWFDFALRPVKNKNTTVVLDQLSGIYRGNLHEVYTDDTYPVFSYDRVEWQRIPQVHYNEEKKSFSFTHFFERDTVWVAYAHPYPLSRMQGVRQEHEGNRDIKIKSLGASEEDREITLFSISDYSQPDNRKKVAVIFALQHPGEDAGGYVAEGVIRFLMTDDERAREIKENWIVHVVPVMNPDGIYRGITRYNANREDLNSIWLKDSDSLDLGPEVKAVRRWVDEQFQSANPPSLLFDIHSHTQQFPANDVFSNSSEFEAIAKEATKSGFPLRFVKREPSPGAAPAYMNGMYNIPAATIELTQSHIEKKYLGIQDYHQYGEKLIKAVHDSFKSE